jgi:hypothetical protein
VNIHDQFPSPYLKAEEFEKPALLTISHVKTEMVGKEKEQRPVLYFKEKEKGVVLNKGNAGVVAELYGDETDDWKGHEIVVFSVPTQNPQGERVNGIRLRESKRKPVPQPAPKAPEPDRAREDYVRPSSADMDDSIPF